MSLFSSVNLEATQSLTVHYFDGDICVLHRAIGLTHLLFDRSSSWPDCQQALGAMLGGMSGLRSLTLHLKQEFEVPVTYPLGPVLKGLTSLTKLDYRVSFSAGSDLRAYASLPGLCNLRLAGIHDVTPPVSQPCMQCLA
jgi:hypothetical protein